MAETRVRLDPDLDTAYTEIAAKAGVPKDFLINHILRLTKDHIEVQLSVTLPDTHIAPMGKANVIVKKSFTRKWQSKI